ncbi:GRP family sugar transporter [Sphingobacterium sp. GVS05A]|uniref:GRP family sugar transporter n=1 Tax=Sphingobacterium TaxID=28453 RepID=UPI001CBB4B9B|nr:GRP family sugar transporter [Sphingobacterium sp. GVS05A]
MFIVSSYAQAIFFCVITMLCWGSWANTQKLANKNWRYELFYWDYVLGIFLLSLIFAFTLGSHGELGRPFVADLKQAEFQHIFNALLGGIIFNAANILLSSAIALAGMAVAFPVGIGTALILGVLINYIAATKGNPTLLFIGVICIAIAIIINAIAYKKVTKTQNNRSSKGLLLSLLAGLLMSLFYRFIASAMDLDNFEAPASGKMTPYTAVFIFSTGILLSNFILNTLLMKKPLNGPPLSYKEYFNGNFSVHTVGLLGGIIWGIGNSLNLIAAGKAGPAISYGLGQGATLVAALWGVFIWREFKGASKQVVLLLTFMFILFIIGLLLLIEAGK